MHAVQWYQLKVITDYFSLSRFIYHTENGSCKTSTLPHSLNPSRDFRCTPSLISHAPLGRASFPPGEAKGDFTNSPGILRGHNCLPQPLSRCGGSSALHETAVRRRGRLHPLNLSGALFSLPPLGVVLRAANRDSNDCRWQSYTCFVPQSGKGGAVGNFELLPFNERHPLCDSLRAA